MIDVITASTIRELISRANNLKLNKDSIISLLKEPNQYILVYYGNKI